MIKARSSQVAGMILTALLLAACGTPQPSVATVTAPPPSQTSPPQSSPGWPGATWQTATPEETGMDSDTLADMLALILDRGDKIHSISIVRHGVLVLEAYFHPFNKDLTHIIHSCTKSITSALVGIAIQEGLIESVDQPVLDFFPGKYSAEANDPKASIRLEDLLTMSSGLECRDSYLYDWQGLAEMRASGDWVQHVLELPMADPPGTKFEYCNGGSYLLAAIVQQASGMTALDFARQHLFEPLGITEVEWPASPQGVNIGWGEMRLKPLDMAKIGYLYLKHGQWEGEQILSPEWVQASTSPHIPAGTLSDDYGYQWWVDDNGYVMALGYAGQTIFVLPEQDMVVVFTSGLAQQDFFIPEELLNNYIIPAAVSSDPLPANQSAVERLASLVRAAQEPSASGNNPTIPETAGEISGKTYVFEDGAAFKEFSLTFNGDSAQFHLTWSKTIDVEVGLDGAYELSESAGYLRAYRGEWLDKDTFTIDYQVVGYAENGTWEIRFENGQALAIYREETTGTSENMRAQVKDDK